MCGVSWDTRSYTFSHPSAIEYSRSTDTQATPDIGLFLKKETGWSKQLIMCNLHVNPESCSFTISQPTTVKNQVRSWTFDNLSFICYVITHHPTKTQTLLFLNTCPTLKPLWVYKFCIVGSWLYRIPLEGASFGLFGPGFQFIHPSVATHLQTDLPYTMGKHLWEKPALSISIKD